MDTTPQDKRLPPVDVLQRLAISESGFIFDPASGHSFSVNSTGLEILRILQKDADFDKLSEWLKNTYQVDERQLERDIIEFFGLLRSQTEAGG